MNYRICLALLGAAAAIGQTTAGSVSGSVVNAKTGEPLRSVPLMAVREGTPPAMRTARADLRLGV